MQKITQQSLQSSFDCINLVCVGFVILLSMNIINKIVYQIPIGSGRSVILWKLNWVLYLIRYMSPLIRYLVQFISFF